MPKALRPALFVSFLLVAACGGNHAPPATADGAPGAKNVEPDGRKRDLSRMKEAMKSMKEAIDAREATVQHAMDVSQGKADPMKTKKTASAAELVTYLRGKKMKISLGKGVHSRREKFMLDNDTNKQDFNNGAGKSVTSDQRREIFDKYEQLGMHLQEVHGTVEGSAQDLLDLNMGIMLGVATIYADRHQHGYELDDTDLQLVADFIASQRRVEQISAAATGLETTYFAVIRDNKDPKVIGKYVEEAQKGFPTTGTASLDEAKAYIASLKKDAQGGKERYYQFTKDLHGEEFFGSYKPGIDEKFAKTEQLMATPMGSRQAATPSAPGNNGGAGAPGSGDALSRGANALAKGDYAGAANAAADLLPIDGRAKTAVKGVVALASGDYKGAINAGLGLVPEGPIKKGLSILASFI